MFSLQFESKKRDSLGRFKGEQKQSYVCLFCSQAFTAYPSQKQKFCSRFCNYKGVLRIPPNQTGKHWNQSEETKKKISLAHKGKKLTLEHRQKMSEQRKGKNKGSDNTQWKGDSVGYGALHDWIKYYLGKASKCEYKNCVYPRKNANNQILYKPKKYHWANKSRKYKRDFWDWIQLCPSCHAKYDRNLLRI